MTSPRYPAALLLALALCAPIVPAQQEEWRILAHATARVGKGPAPVSFGVPFARGALKDVEALRLWRNDDGAHLPAQSRVLSSWPDGSVRWALVDTLVASDAQLAIGLSQKVEATPDLWQVEEEGERLRLSIGEQSWLVRDGDAVLGMRARLLDRLDKKHEGVVDSAEVIERGPLRVVVRVRGHHPGEEGGPDPFHTFTAHVALFAATGGARVDWTLENTPLENPTGPLAFQSYELLADVGQDAATLELPSGEEPAAQLFWRQGGPRAQDEVLRVGEEPRPLAKIGDLAIGIGALDVRLVDSAPNHPAALLWNPGGPLRIALLPPAEGKEYWLDDATRKTWRLLLGHTSPLPHVAVEPADVAASLAWSDEGHFVVPAETGPVKLPDEPTGWADWGEFFTKNTHVTGSPRNRLSVFLEAVQSGREDLFRAAEARALHARDLRPYHLAGFSAERFPDANLHEGLPHPNEPPENRLGRTGLEARFKEYKEGLPENGHGYNGFDPEHMTLDDVYELYLLTGDWLALDALRSAGEAMLTWHYVQEGYDLGTSRIFGWTLRALVQCSRATGDRRYLDAAASMVRRADEERGKGDVKWLRRGKKDPRHIADAESDQPWMVAVAMHGLAAYWMETEDPRVTPMLADLSDFCLSAFRGNGFVNDLPCDDPAYRGGEVMALGTSSWVPGGIAAAAFVTGDHGPVDALAACEDALRAHSSRPLVFGGAAWPWWQTWLASRQQRDQ